MKPAIRFRSMTFDDIVMFCREVGFYPDQQFNGIVAYHDDVVMGMVGFDDWTATSARLHWFIKQPRCLMPLWREVVNYLHQHGRRKAIGMTPGDNERALRMIFRHLGFRELARIEHGYAENIDLVISECDINGQAIHTQGADAGRNAGEGSAAGSTSASIPAHAGRSSGGSEDARHERRDVPSNGWDATADAGVLSAAAGREGSTAAAGR